MGRATSPRKYIRLTAAEWVALNAIMAIRGYTYPNEYLRELFDRDPIFKQLHQAASTQREAEIAKIIEEVMASGSK